MIRRTLYNMDEQQDGHKEESFTSLCVQNPFTEGTQGGEKYTSYEIVLQTNDIAFTLPKSCVRRRFSDFLWLRRQLVDNEPEISPPELPAKSFLRSRFNKSVIQQRIHKLQEFLQSVIKVPTFVGDSSLHLFLQTQLSVSEMEDCLAGRTGKAVLDTVLDHGDSCLHANSFGSDSGVEFSLNTATYSINHANNAPIPHDIFSPTRPRSPLQFFPHSTPIGNLASEQMGDVEVHNPSSLVEVQIISGSNGDLEQSHDSGALTSENSSTQDNYEDGIPESDTQSYQLPNFNSTQVGTSGAATVFEGDQPMHVGKGLCLGKATGAYGSLDTLMSSSRMTEQNLSSCGSTASMETVGACGRVGSSTIMKSSRRVTFNNEVTVAKVIENFPPKKWQKKVNDQV